MPAEISKIRFSIKSLFRFAVGRLQFTVGNFVLYKRKFLVFDDIPVKQKLPTANCKLIRSVFLLFAFALTLPALAQEATITGRVTGPEGSPVESAAVGYILGGKSKGTFTDAKGNFTLTVPAGQPLMITVQLTGFKRYDVPVKLTAGEIKNFAIELEPKGGDTTEVYGVLGTGDYFPPGPIQNIPSPSGDFIGALRLVIGGSVNNELSSQYSIRGGSFDENKLYINGIEVYRPLITRSGQQEGLTIVNGDMVDRVFFSAGGYEAKYGDAMSSVLDITYRRPKKFGGTFSAGLLGGSFEVEGISKDERFTWMLGARQKSNRYLLNKLDTRGDYTTSFTDVQAFLTYNFTEHWRLDYLGNYAQNKYELRPETRETEFGTLNQALRFTVFFEGQEVNSFKTNFNALALNYMHPNERLRLRFIGSSFFSSENETFDIEGAYYIDQLETDFGKPTFGQVAFNRGVGGYLNHARNFLDALVINGEHKGDYTYNANNSILSWGLRYQHEQITDELSEWGLVDSAGYSIPFYPLEVLEVQGLIKGKAELASSRAMAFVQHIWNWKLRDTSQLELNAGVRSHYWNMNGQTIVSPRVNLSWKPHWKRQASFRVAGGLYSQPPFYRELRDFNGTVHKNVKAQTAVHAVLGGDIHFKLWNRPFRFITEAYYKYLDNLVPYEVTDVRLRYFGENQAYGYAYGIDFKLNGQFVRKADSWVNLSILRTRENLYNDRFVIYLNSDGDTIYPGYTVNNIAVDSIVNAPGFIPRPTDQIVNFSMYFQDYLPMLPDCKMSLGLVVGTGLPFGPPNHQRHLAVLRMPPYRRVDIGFSYQVIKEEKPLKESNPFRFMKSLWIGAEVYNLLQVNNTVSYYWVKDVTGRLYGIPNYLTNRQLSVRLIAKF
ncbi:MAG: tonb-dependent receptor plug [Bacteroidetes bacterium]|nr:MAG: tonb-dependent receptor plug [Bacteroidota bacterium]